MRPTSFALVTVLALAAAAAQAQTAQSSGATPPASAAAPSETGKPHLSHDCKEEVKKACGHAHGDEMHKCIASSMDLNKFSPACKTELSQSQKPSG